MTDSNLPFANYITNCIEHIKNRRLDLNSYAVPAATIINANAPFELYPIEVKETPPRYKYGVLLIHGLFDCPFAFRDIGKKLQENGILSKAILLPGHGTRASDLLTVTYQDWIQTMRYGIESLRKEVDQVFIMGYSTGAALAVYEAFGSADIAGILLLAPAIRVKFTVEIKVNLEALLAWFSKNGHWFIRNKEIDYTKYLSVTFNAIHQIEQLTHAIQEKHQTQTLACPVLMVVSQDDETISYKAAKKFFSDLKNEKNELLVYSSEPEKNALNANIIVRSSIYPQLHINSFSHVCLPFASDNFHYGQNGDYPYAARINQNNITYGAYNRLEVTCLQKLYRWGLLRSQRKELTYNPDFDFMVDKIIQFIKT